MTVASGAPAFLITVDTEGDDLWSRPREITARNAETLPRFQELCERYGLKPTYLANWEMARSDVFVEFGTAALKRGTAEIGMHLHAWNSPPEVPLTEDDYRYQPYLMEYPPDVLREKVHVMTATLEDVFGVKMLSHRAGRWGLDETYAQVLIEQGYRVDCSVTPHVDWRANRGDPRGRGGPDFRAFPATAYHLDRDDISRAGTSTLIEVPMTIIPRSSAGWDAVRGAVGRIPHARRVLNRYVPAVWWLRPNGRNRDRMLKILSIAEQRSSDYVEFMIHSSELMAGGSPTFRTRRQIEALYDDLEALFELAGQRWTGLTLSQYGDRHQ
jgi:hypothetical protein